MKIYFLRQPLLPLTQIKETMGARASEMNRMAVQVFTNAFLTPFMVKDGGYGAYQAAREFEKHGSSNGLRYTKVFLALL